MGKRFSGKVALVTGSSRGIGRAIALRLGEEGASVAVNYVRKKSKAEEVVHAIKAHGSNAVSVRANMGEPEQVKALVAAVKETFGRLDILVNNAVSAVLKPVRDLTPYHVEYTLNINVKSFILLVQQALPMLEAGRGKIISITSLGSHRYIDGYGILGASKAAVESLTRTLAVELAPKGINVNAVCGGPIETEAIQVIPNYEHLASVWKKLTPEKRLGQPEDLAGVVAFLCSDDARWIRGQVLVADGGLSLF